MSGSGLASSALLSLSAPSRSSFCHLFLPTRGVDYKGFFCCLLATGATALCFLVELSSLPWRKVLYLLKVKFKKGRSGCIIPAISHTARDFVHCPGSHQTGSGPSPLILTRRPTEFQPSICWGFWEHKAAQKSRETKHACHPLSAEEPARPGRTPLICP